VTWLRTAGLRLVLAIGLGFALWIFVSYTETPDRLTKFRNLPVSAEDLAPSLVIVDQNGLPNPSLPPVDVTLRSIGETSVTPSSNDIQAYVDLRDRGPGEYSVPVGARVTIPGRKPEIAVIAPDFLSIRIEQEITRTVPLTIEVEGSVPFSYENLPASATVRSQPAATVSVRGPQSRVERVVVARAAVNIDGRTASYDSPRQLDAIGADAQEIQGVLVEPASVNVLVPIVSSAGIKRVPVVPQVVGEPASGYVVSGLMVEPQFVRLAGGAGALESVQSVTTEKVDIQGASRTISRTVRLSEPAFTPLLFGEPISATVTVRITPIERPFQVTLPVPVQLIDIGPGLLGSANPPVVQVTLSGTAAQLATLDTESLVASVSVRGQGAGVYRLTPSLTLPNGIALAGEPPRVTVVLRLPPSPTPSAAPADTTTPPSAAPADIVTPSPATPPAEPTATPAVEPVAAPTAEPPSETPVS
jgi:YbbR domain-containing protein